MYIPATIEYGIVYKFSGFLVNSLYDIGIGSNIIGIYLLCQLNGIKSSTVIYPCNYIVCIELVSISVVSIIKEREIAYGYGVYFVQILVAHLLGILGHAVNREA